MSEDGYNGWANRETWAFMLNVNNDQASYEWARGEAAEFLMDLVELGKDGWTNDLGKHVIEQWDDIYEDAMLHTSSAAVRQKWVSIMRDIGSLWRVNEDEVGRAFVEDVLETDTWITDDVRARIFLDKEAYGAITVAPEPEERGDE